MGYTTEFTGRISVEPPLSQKEIEYINKFAGTRRMNRTNGPYFVAGSGDCGQGSDSDVINYNHPPDGQPGLWCQWEASSCGTTIVWDENEKFYHAAEWMAYIIKHFLGSAPFAANELSFLQGHVLNGEIEAQGEEPSDRWKLIVKDNQVHTVRGKWVWECDL